MSIAKMRPDEIYDALLLMREKCGVEFFLKEHHKFTDVPCPACRNDSPDFIFNKYGFRHVRCSACKTLFVTPRPQNAQLIDYYSSYEAPLLWTKLLIQTNNERKKIQFQPRIHKLKKILENNDNNKQLFVDIGAGNGNFAKIIEEESLFANVLALDISPDCIESCKKQGLSTRIGTIDVLDDDSVDFLTMNDLIEHVFDPFELLHICYRKLRKNGIVMIGTPNGEGFDFKLLNDKTENITPPEHLNYFNPYSLKIILERAGFAILDVETPGILDVDIVKRQIVKNNIDLSPNNSYLDYLLSSTSSTVLTSFQNFLSENLLSSHMLAFAVKR
ncbi:MAG: class I SAM-dependent methyltransferase [Candidatus Thermoplasmatota archaeon]|nr:class I SAM-dependent methyltransferase [Candidatus Thermoplasmatota archaeon]